ncbi:DMT family transporter [Klebsiella pneumoniae]|uniref:DMT family transporter n=1 Tax=Klebsiella pneumoniae TaxID=573 RepID=UPI0009357FD1|nr:DMT family transporter [Klebsiella pneumoniae]EKX6047936.1 EamA family transporter [Klebsiella pneumoniae]ELJ9586629.1 EamA family transporter [Klebsiella pneumoniae]OKG73237.1 EamA family transporter [Klebsiella pneumoniae]RNO09940.1 EamA/RhaT family transporter [Klebsiella pneumoniae]RNO49733.1 EamA/RhaT family transporter [Klebsiella pneumoniae]
MRVIDYGRLLLLAALWGASFLFMRITTPAFGALNSAFLRVLFAAIALGLLLGVQGKWSGYQGKFTSTLQLGVINSGLPFLMYCLAAQWLPAGYSATLNATAPMMGVLIGALCFAEPLTLLLPGIGACLTATACYGLAGFLTRRWIQQRGGLEAERVALGSQVGATLFLFPFFLWSCWHGPAVDWRQSLPWIAIVMLGVVCTAAGYIIYFRLIADIGPLRSLSVTFLIPPFAALWGYLCLGETVEKGLILGALLVCVALWMIIVPSGRKRGVPDGA